SFHTGSPVETKKDVSMSNSPTQEVDREVPVGGAVDRRRWGVISLYVAAARLDRFGFGMLRFGLVVVLCWIGGLKAANYEAEGIVPFVANSPLMDFFYHHPAPEYRERNQAGGLNGRSHEWNVTNGTYVFSYGLGCVIVGLGLLIALHPLLPQVAAVGSFL